MNGNVNCCQAEAQSVAGAVAVSTNNRVRCPVRDCHADRNGAAIAAVVSDPEADLLFADWQEGLAYRDGPDAAIDTGPHAAVAQIDGQISAVRLHSDQCERIRRLVPGRVPEERVLIDRPAGKGRVAGRDEADASVAERPVLEAAVGTLAPPRETRWRAPRPRR